MLRICPAVFGLLMVAGPAAAQQEQPLPSRPGISPAASVLLGKDLRALGSMGGFGDPENGTAGMVGGASVLVRIALFEVGVLGQGHSAALDDYTGGSGSLLAGVALQTPFGLRADLLGQVGIDSYSGVGADHILGSAPPGASGTLPVVGARLGLSYRFFRDASEHPEVGLWAVYEDDVGRLSVRYWTPGNCTPGGCGLFSTRPSWVTQVVGTHRFSVQLSVGIDFDLR
jgi:hypothetical protein